MHVIGNRDHMCECRRGRFSALIVGSQPSPLRSNDAKRIEPDHAATRSPIHSGVHARNRIGALATGDQYTLAYNVKTDSDFKAGSPTL